MNRDGATTSLWQQSGNAFKSNDSFSEIVHDVLIVGGGITGLSTALLLQQAGKKCVLTEAQNIGFGTTGGTTAHLNTFFDTPYYKMAKSFNDEAAKSIAVAALDAIDLIRKNVADYNIDCTLEKKDAYLFALNQKQSNELEDIVASANEVGIVMEFTNENPFPVPYIKVAKIPFQWQFNPVLYINGLAQAFTNAGGTLLEHCRVTDVEEGETIIASSAMGNIKAKALIYATHIPPGINLLHLRCAPYRSYVLAVKLKNGYPTTMGYDMNDPYHYYRTQLVDGEPYLIAGGEDHKTAHADNTDDCFRRLESYVRTYFSVDSIAFKWSSQYFETTDGLPYIGHLPGGGRNIYVATGYGGNGMIYGSIAAMVLAGKLTGNEKEYAAYMEPGRVKPVAGFVNFVKEGADVVAQLVKTVLPAEKMKDLSAMARGEAKIVKYEDQTFGLFKDEEGGLHAVGSLCPHMKCSVAWNQAERSWDCPCHGSRFSYDGAMLTAPATSDLKTISLPGNDQ